MKRDMSVVGIDIAKRVFHLVGLDERGKIVLLRRWQSWRGATPDGQSGADHHWDGSLWWRPLLGAVLARAGA